MSGCRLTVGAAEGKRYFEELDVDDNMIAKLSLR